MSSIFTTPTDIKKYVPNFTLNISTDSITPFEALAEQWLVNCDLGISYALIEALKAAPADPLRVPYERCISWYVAYLCFNTSTVKISDSGNHVDVNQDTAQPSDQQFKSAKYGALRMAYDQLEILVWDYFLPNYGTYLLFDPSKAVEFFNYRPHVFNQHQTLKQEGKLEDWKAMLPYMRKVERVCLPKLLCGLYASFQTIFRNSLKGSGTLTTLQVDLLFHIRNIASELTVKYAKPYLNNQITHGGAKVKQVHGFQEAASNKSHDIEYYYQTMREQKESAINELVTFLTDNADEFVDWRDSTCNPEYIDPNIEVDECGCETATPTMVFDGGGGAVIL